MPVLALRPALALICPQDKSQLLTVAAQPCVLLRALPVSPASSWELTLSHGSLCPGHIHLLSVSQTPKRFLSDIIVPVLTFCLDVAVAQALCLPSALGSERAPHLLLTICVTFYCLCINHLQQKWPSPLIICSLPPFAFIEGCTVFLFFPGWRQHSLWGCV